MDKTLKKLKQLEEQYVELYKEEQELKSKQSDLKVKIQSLIGKNTYTGDSLTVSFVPGSTSDKISIVDVRKNEKIYKKLKNIGLVKEKISSDSYRYKVKS